MISSPELCAEEEEEGWELPQSNAAEVLVKTWLIKH